VLTSRLAAQEPTAAAGAQSSNGPEITEVGCLNESDGSFILSTESTTYHLIGNTDGLRKNEGCKVRVTGAEVFSGDVSVRVLRISNVRRIHKSMERAPLLDGTFRWNKDVRRTFGVSVQYPENFEPEKEGSEGNRANFVDSRNREPLLNLEIPREIYPHTTFAGGNFLVYVSPDIRSAATCRNFEDVGSNSPTTSVVHGIRYSELILGSAAAGTVFSYYYFHTYQHGLCYEFQLELAAGSPGLYPLPCELDSIDEDALLNALLHHVSFFRPAAEDLSSKALESTLPPAVITFIASSNESLPNEMASFTISWSTEGADHVQLHFECPSDVDVYVYRPYMHCSFGTTYLPASGSVEMNVSNRSRSQASIEVTLQPFSNGNGDREFSKSVILTVEPSE
jgi:hypothetical protein